MSNYDYELTGFEEHMNDEAYECGELAAMRAEAEREARAEAAIAAWEEEEAEAEDRRRYPGGRCVPYSWGRGPHCETAEEAACPF